MDNILINLGLLQLDEAYFNISKEKFIENLSNIVKDEEVGLELNSSFFVTDQHKIYRGKISSDNFIIQIRKISIFNNDPNLAVAEGNLFKFEDGCKLKVRVTAMLWIFILPSILLLFGLMIFYYDFYLENKITLNGFLGCIFSIIVIFLIPYFLLRQSIYRLGERILRDLYFINRDES